MKTELIIFNRPNSGALGTSIDVGIAEPGWSQRAGLNYSPLLNPNKGTTADQMANRFTAATLIDFTFNPIPKSGSGTRIDLDGDVDIPITYNIADITEPDKKKTSWSKTIKIPGTKNNNRTFSHIYQLSGDGWVKIGNISVYQNFNPNLRTEIILLSDGIQVLKGNLQLKTISKDNIGNVTYDVILTGDLTSLFFDVGISKLNDLDFSEWDHDWSYQNIMKSWDGDLKKNGAAYSNTTYGPELIISKMFMDVRTTGSTNRLGIETTVNHNYKVGDFIMVNPGLFTWLETSTGQWAISEITSPKRFTLSTPYPLSLVASAYYDPGNAWIDTLALNPPYGIGKVKSVTMNGTGYVYPLVSWGDEINAKSFPITSMAPSYFMKEIWDKIFDKTNSKYQSTFLDSDFFKRLILTQKKTSYDLTATQIRERAFSVASSWEFTTKVSDVVGQWKWFNTGSHSNVDKSLTYNNPNVVSGLGSPSRIIFAVDAGFATTATSSLYFFDGVGEDGIGPGGNWDNSTYEWNVKKSGEYGISCNLQMDAWCDIDGSEGSHDGTASLAMPEHPSQVSASSEYKIYIANHAGAYSSGPGNISPNPYIQVKMFLVRLKNGIKTYSDMNTQNFVMGGEYYKFNDANKLVSTEPSKWSYFGRYRPDDWKDKSLKFTTSSFFAEGEKVWIEVKYYVHSRTSSGRCNSLMVTEKDSDGFYNYDLDTSWYLRIRGAVTNKMSTLSNSPSPKSGELSTIYGREFLPKDMTCKDFLKSVIKMFNLHIEADRSVERLYYIEPRDDYYFNGSNGLSDYVDWTNLMDADSPEITPMGQLLGKNYIFSNKKETDYWNKRFLDERGRDYMSYTKQIENDFIKTDVKIETLFGSTVMINNPENSDVVMPAVLMKESNGTIKPVSNTAPRVLIWGGLRPYSNRQGNGLIVNTAGYYGGAQGGIKGWELVSSISTLNTSGATGVSVAHIPFNRYPYAGTTDSPLDPMWDINWFNMEDGDFVYWDYARWTNHNLYNAYWKNFIEEVSDPSSMVLKAEFNLSPKDVFELDFRKIYVIDGVYYRLQKVIDYNPVKDVLTKVELLKLRSLSRFKRTSIWPNQYFDRMIDDTRAISTTTTIRPPFIKTWRDSSYTNDLPQSLGGGTIAVVGLANQVGLGMNISVAGNENVVGENCNNVNITSGNGIVISGGLDNINVVGTSNVNISESNTTYINGVRYKNGVPISRCNVINAGSTSATYSRTPLINDTNRNVNITVVNAGEDCVIPSGNSTYENVINAGKDVILNDMVELGLTTRTTPNPKSNFSGEAVVDLGTQSMVEYVRSNRGNIF